MDSIRGLLILMFVLILGCLLTTVQGNEMQISMQVLSEVKVQDKFVRLKHLVPIMEDQKAGDILICRRPVKDKPLVLSKEYLEKLLVIKGAENVLEMISFPESVTVHNDLAALEDEDAPQEKVGSMKQTAKTEIDSNEIMIVVTAEIEKSLSSLNADVTIYARNKHASWFVNVPENYELKVMPGISIKANMVTAKVGVYNNDDLIERKVFNFEADIFVQGLACTHDMEAGSIIKKGDFVWQKTPYSADVYNSVTSEKDLIGKVLKRTLKIGSMVAEKEVEMPDLVGRGEIVSVVLKGKGFEIKTSGVAQDKAKAGELIEVILKGSKKKITCMVKDVNEVEVFN